MPIQDPSLGKKLNTFLKSFGSKAHQKYGKTIEALPGKVGSALTNLKDTIEDVPSIAGTQAITAGPRFLDTLNDYIYKPVTRNVVAAVTGKEIKGPNTIDRIADDARSYKDNFFKTHDFNQAANRKYGALLGDVLEAAAPIPAGSKLKLGTTIGKKIFSKAPKVVDTLSDIVKGTGGKVDDLLTSSKALTKVDDVKKTGSIFDKAKTSFKTFLSKDRKIKKLKDGLTSIEKEYAKNKKNLSIEEQGRIEVYIANKTDEINSLTKNSFLKHLGNTRKQTKISNELNKIANPEGFFKKSFKGLGKIAVVGLIGTGAYELLTDDEKAEIESTDIATDVPNPFVKTGESKTTPGDTSNNDTAMEEKKDGTGQGKVKDTNSEKIPTTTSGTSSAPVVAGEVFSRDGSPVQLLLVNGSYGVKKPDGTFYTLTTGVTDGNKRHKFTMVANSPLPF